ncbi:hypothetical protein ACLB2K_016904 [Fragaria x ananassa]
MFSHSIIILCCRARLLCCRLHSSFWTCRDTPVKTKKPETVTVNDYVYSELGVAGNTSNLFRVGDTLAFADQVSGLNGLGILMAHVVLAPGGVAPLHIHRGATVVFLLQQGTLVAGFISSDQNTFFFFLKVHNTIYITTIKSGAQLHFQLSYYWSYSDPAVGLGFASYSSRSPGLQILDYAPFQNIFPTQLAARTTLLDIPDIRNLKFNFGEFPPPTARAGDPCPILKLSSSVATPQKELARFVLGEENRASEVVRVRLVASAA